MPCKYCVEKCKFELVIMVIEIKVRGQIQWLIPIVPTLWEAEVGGSLRSGIQDQPSQHGETLSLLKIEKLARTRLCLQKKERENSKLEKGDGDLRIKKGANVVKDHKSLGLPRRLSAVTFSNDGYRGRMSQKEVDLSVALYKHFLSLPDGENCSDASRELRLLCCDIDPVLVKRAKKECPFPDALTFITLDFMNQRTRKVLLSSFLSQFGRSVFDIGFCMSVTMWIHLNHGDHGLWEFLAHLSSLCRYLLVEPQPWKCYRAAARRLRKLGLHDFDHFHSLAIRGDMTNQIVQILTQDHGMELICCFGNTSWDRSLLFFRAKQTIETHPIPESLIEKGKEAGHNGSHLLRRADHEVRSSRPAWPTWRNPISTKNTKKKLASRETRFHHVGQAGLELLTSGDPPASASQKCWDNRREPRHWSRNLFLTAPPDDSEASSSRLYFECLGFHSALLYIFFLGEAEGDVTTVGDAMTKARGWSDVKKGCKSRNAEIAKCSGLHLKSQHWEAEAGGSLELSSSRPAWATWQNPESEKNTKKLAGSGGMYL
ncbi:RNA 5'-monophosphate methyltransferase [Plecturocebus cupreus]